MRADPGKDGGTLTAQERRWFMRPEGEINADLNQTSLLTPQPPWAFMSPYPVAQKGMRKSQSQPWGKGMEEQVPIQEKCLFHLVLLPRYPSLFPNTHTHRMNFQHAHMLLQTCLICSERNTVWLVSPLPSSFGYVRKVIWILAVVLLALRRMENCKFIFKWKTTTLKLFSPCWLKGIYFCILVGYVMLSASMHD